VEYGENHIQQRRPARDPSHGEVITSGDAFPLRARGGVPRGRIPRLLVPRALS